MEFTKNELKLLSAAVSSWYETLVDEDYPKAALNKWKKLFYKIDALLVVENTLTISLSYADYCNRLPNKINDIIKPFKACRQGGGMVLDSGMYNHTISYPNIYEK